jgi:hypothetical protein
MNRLIIATIALVLASFATAGYVSILAGYSSAAYANVSVITMGANSSYSNTTSQQAIYAAEAYLIDRLGQSYYSGYVSYYGSESYGNTSYAYFAYSVPFSNGTSAMDVLDLQIPAKRLLGITVSLNGTKVVGYIGPSKPYFVNISPSNAINLSEGYGIQNGNACIEGVFNSIRITPNSTYSIAWAVLGGSPLKSGIYQGMYINAESGNVMGEYDYNKLVAAAQPGSAYAYGSSGNYSMFYVQNDTGHGAAPSSNAPDSQYIFPLIVVAFLILGLAMYFSRRER